ncbi:MAG: hypothetical protein JXA41_02945 [Deltaproteobacteria bacterium]|nr:hypothetical protein [Deltaproteobacteria bacterium]
MEGIYFVGNNWCLNPPEKIFAHQYGAGFIIVGEDVRDTIEVPIILAVTLMQKVLLSGGIARAVIAAGDSDDHRGCFPPCIRNLSTGSNCFHLGRGVMTTFPAMGTALIRTVNLAKTAPAGGLLIIHESLRTRIPREMRPTTTGNQDLMSIDWIHTKVKALEQVQRLAGIPGICPSGLEDQLKDYIKKNDLTDDWKENTLHFLGMEEEYASLLENDIMAPSRFIESKSVNAITS